MKEWLTLDEAAVLVGRTKRTLYNWIDNDRIKPRRSASDGSYRVKLGDVQAAEETVRKGRPKGSGKTK